MGVGIRGPACAGAQAQTVVLPPDGELGRGCGEGVEVPLAGEFHGAAEAISKVRNPLSVVLRAFLDSLMYLCII